MSSSMLLTYLMRKVSDAIGAGVEIAFQSLMKTALSEGVTCIDWKKGIISLVIGNILLNFNKIMQYLISTDEEEWTDPCLPWRAGGGGGGGGGGWPLSKCTFLI